MNGAKCQVEMFKSQKVIPSQSHPTESYPKTSSEVKDINMINHWFPFNKALLNLYFPGYVGEGG